MGSELENDDERTAMMQKDVLLVATAGLSLLNGQSASPLFWSFDQYLKPFIAPIVSSPILLFYFTSLFLSLMTLLLAGVPAAIYERFRRTETSTPLSIGIWFSFTLLLTFPTLRNMLGFVD